MGMGISFRLEIVVCGSETTSCVSCAVRVTQGQKVPIPGNIKTYTAADSQSSFSITTDSSGYTGQDYGWLPSDSTPPNGRSQCGLQSVGLFTDCAGTTPLPAGPISLDNSGVNAAGHKPVLIDQ